MTSLLLLSSLQLTEERGPTRTRQPDIARVFRKPGTEEPQGAVLQLLGLRGVLHAPGQLGLPEGPVTPADQVGQEVQREALVTLYPELLAGSQGFVGGVGYTGLYLGHFTDWEKRVNLKSGYNEYRQIYLTAS